MEKTNEKNGFTFVSILFALVAISITIPLLMYLLELSIYQDNHEDISVFHFFHFIQDDLFLTQEYKIVDNQLYLTFYDGREVEITKYNDLIRKQVSGQGHEIYLRNVKNFIVEETNTGFTIYISNLAGDTFEKTYTFHY
ncbi:MAG TPA: ComGF family competence protein [Bacillota bacterium]|nr:ComGF family competence protein [Bacillota bacterium]